MKADLEYGLIRAIRTATTALHDPQMDLSIPREVAYRDRGYFGMPAKEVRSPKAALYQGGFHINTGRAAKPEYIEEAGAD